MATRAPAACSVRAISAPTRRAAPVIRMTGSRSSSEVYRGPRRRRKAEGGGDADRGAVAGAVERPSAIPAHPFAGRRHGPRGSARRNRRRDAELLLRLARKAVFLAQLRPQLGSQRILRGARRSSTLSRAGSVRPPAPPVVTTRNLRRAGSARSSPPWPAPGRWRRSPRRRPAAVRPTFSGVTNSSMSRPCRPD